MRISSETANKSAELAAKETVIFVTMDLEAGWVERMGSRSCCNWYRRMELATFWRVKLELAANWQCCGSRSFWYGSESCFSLWYRSGSCFLIGYGSGSDCWIQIRRWIRIRPFDTDTDPYHFKEVMYLKWYFWYIFTWFSLSVGPTGPTQKVFFVNFPF